MSAKLDNQRSIVREGFIQAEAQGQPMPLWVRTFVRLISHLPAGRYRLMDLLPRCTSGHRVAESNGENRFRFACDLRDDIAREVCFTGKYEPQTTALVRSILGAGQTFLDVGANWGYFSLLASVLVGEGGRVMSLEPDPRLFQLLLRNLELNNFDTGLAFKTAAGEEIGTLELYGYDERLGNFGLSSLTHRPCSGGPSFVVETAPLDAIIERASIENVDLLKMDIEGAEYLAVRGLERGLEKGIYKRILLELHPGFLEAAGHTVAEVMDPFKSAGYRLWTVEDSFQARRHASYAPILTPREFTRAVRNWDVELTEWPHVLMLAPEVDDSFLDQTVSN